MSPEQASAVVPISAFFIIFASIFINLWIVKRKIRVWKKHSTIYFISSVATISKKHSASLWIKRFGYDEADALVIGKYQLLASVELLAGIFVLFAIASSLQTH